ncbi:MAG TPA: ATP-binding cassette domain-containing protein [Gemmatimonadales bacterium]|nr:ATP-binding cassette domain-containing protein [Gemmatimonadales bacterium]
MAEPVIEFREVVYRVDGRVILGPVSLSVASGEVLVLVGRSGSGKTTALRLINGLILPAAGDVRVEGRSTREWDRVRLRRRVGYVIQEVGLFPHMTVERNVGLVPRLERWPPARTRARVEELLALVGLPHEQFGRRLPHQLSGGQRQRVGVARALAADPPILLCDEPFGSVDPIARAELQAEFKALIARLGRTVVFVTHDVREALALATRIVVLEGGRVHFAGDPLAFQASGDAHVTALRELA